jgi:hydroxyacylglutathione hydrolase
VVADQPIAPPYFAVDSELNRQARSLLDEASPPPALDVDDVLAQQDAGARVLDTRSPQDFAAGHLRGSVNIGLEGRFAEYAGDVLDPSRSIVLVADPGQELEAKVRLARVGFDRVAGHLAEPEQAFIARPEVVVTASRLRADELAERRTDLADLVLVDVRNPAEVDAGAVPGAVTIPLPALVTGLDGLDPTRPTVVYCASGYRSSTAASLLRSEGFADVSDLIGGFAAWQVLAER